ASGGTRTTPVDFATLVKKNPSAVAGKGSRCFGAQVGARAKTVVVKIERLQRSVQSSPSKSSPSQRHRAKRLEPRARPTKQAHFFLELFFVVFLEDFLAAFFAMALNHLLSVIDEFTGREI
ncbi:MAG TPA: hypothetical protein VLI90_17760, partial [Tepidisphaeraceae bacterium]|nr:hypothetical protein [Tepidisphaeraceae bacterium]